MLELAIHRLPKLRVIASLFELLHEHAITYCNLKGNERHLRICMTGESDIDILFDEDQKEKLEQVLAMLQFKKFQAIKPRQYLKIVDFLALDEESGKVIHLHAHFRIPVGEPCLKDYQLGIEHHILNTRHLNDDFGTYCISPSYELIMLYITESLKIRHRDLLPIYLKGKTDVGSKANHEYNWLKKRTTNGEMELSIKLLFNDQVTISKFFIEDFNRKRLIRLASLLRQLFGNTSLYSPLQALTVRWYREITVSMLRKLSRILPWPVLSLRFNPRGGAIIGITGSDLAEQLAIIRSLKETFKRKLDVYTVGIEWRVSSVDKEEVRTGPDQKRRFRNSGISKLLRSIQAVVLARKNVFKMSGAKAARDKGALVICSYYIEDPSNGSAQQSHLGDLMEPNNPFGRFLGRIENKYNTRTRNYLPDILFEVSPAKQATRDYSHEDGQATIRHRYLSDKLKVVRIEGSEPLKRKLDTIRRETWNML